MDLQVQALDVRRLHTCEPMQGACEDFGLQISLGRQVDMLEVTPAAPTGARQGAGRVNPRRRWRTDLDGISADDAPVHISDADSDALARKCMPDEQRPSGMVGDHVTTVSNPEDVDLELVADPQAPHSVWASHPRTVAPRSRAATGRWSPSHPARRADGS